MFPYPKFLHVGCQVVTLGGNEDSCRLHVSKYLCASVLSVILVHAADNAAYLHYYCPI
jgi:hypothetical protein